MIGLAFIAAGVLFVAACVAYGRELERERGR